MGSNSGLKCLSLRLKLVSCLDASQMPFQGSLIWNIDVGFYSPYMELNEGQWQGS